MTPCEREQKTQHYRGEFGGFGPVRSAERVILAVFETTDLNELRVMHTAFDNGQLKKNGISLARNMYTSKREFLEKIVDPGRHSKGECVGVVIANVGELRTMTQELVLKNSGPKTVRALCLFDLVENGDIESHAVATYGDQIRAIPGEIKDGQIGKARNAIRMELAEAFSDLLNVSNKRWATDLEVKGWRGIRVLKARVRNLMRRLKEWYARSATK